MGCDGQQRNNERTTIREIGYTTRDMLYFMMCVFLSLMDLELAMTFKAVFPGIFKTDSEVI